MTDRLAGCAEAIGTMGVGGLGQHPTSIDAKATKARRIADRLARNHGGWTRCAPNDSTRQRVEKPLDALRTPGALASRAGEHERICCVVAPTRPPPATRTRIRLHQYRVGCAIELLVKTRRGVETGTRGRTSAAGGSSTRDGARRSV